MSASNPPKLDMTADEQKRIKEAFKNEEFRKLFFDYMDEISDPKNKELYEKEISMLEAEKGNDVRFIKPTAAYVIKTTDQSDKKKVFINMCWSNEIEPATLDPKPVIKNGRPSQGWHIPYNLTRPREDVDHAMKPCTVYDCVFHPDIIKLGSQNERVSQMLANTALEGIQNQFNAKLDTAFKTIKMKSKGTPAMSMIRTPKPSFTKPETETSLEYVKRMQADQTKHHAKMPGGNTATPPSSSSDKKTLITELSSAPAAEHGIDAVTDHVREPVYTIVHQDVHGDYQKYTTERERASGARPDRIKIQIALPNVTSANETELDVSALTLTLKVPSKYELHLDLPFPVFSDKGTAKFDKAKSVLTVTVPVVPAPKTIQPVLDIETMQEDHDNDPENRDDVDCDADEDKRVRVQKQDQQHSAVEPLLNEETSDDKADVVVVDDPAMPTQPVITHESHLASVPVASSVVNPSTVTSDGPVVKPTPATLIESIDVDASIIARDVPTASGTCAPVNDAPQVQSQNLLKPKTETTHTDHGNNADASTTTPVIVDATTTNSTESNKPVNPITFNSKLMFDLD